MPRILRRYNFAPLLFVIALFAVLMGLPGGQSSVWNAFRPTVSAATTFTVTSIGDGADNNPGNGVCDDGTGLCTLRAAIQEANAAAGTDTINFAFAGNNLITLNTQLPSFSGNISIAGPGSSQLTIQRSSAVGTPIFQVFSFAGINGNFNNSVSGLTISNGNATGPFSSNSGGGGIYSSSGSTLTLTDVVISGSTSTNGGGLFNGNSASATLTNCKVTGNNSPNGGGIFNGGTLTLTNTTVSGNAAPNGAGGGIVNSGGTVNVNNSTISGNTSDAQGAGIVNKNVFSTPGVLTITNSTLSGNNATGILASGEGAISNFSGGNTLTLNSSTVTANTAVGSGTAVGGLFNGSGSTANIRNSIVANNTSTLAFQDLSGTFTSQGFNLIGKANGTEGFTNGSNGDQVGTNALPLDPKLGTLADNGGPTKTHVLLLGSPAIDAGNSSLTTDQRGAPRPIDDVNVVNAAGSNGSDIGAYEAHTFQVNSTADASDGACTPLGTGNGCTLREAIEVANAQAGAELIVFDSALTASGPVTISLLSALPDLASDMIISGPDTNVITVERNRVPGTPAFRIFTVNSGKTITISGLGISNGIVFGGSIPAGYGGGIYNDGSLTLINVAVTGNASSGGGPGGAGAIYNHATLTLTNSLVSANTSGSSGVAGIISEGPLTLTNSTVSNNITTGSVGGILNNGTSTITNSTISGNSAFSAGGIFNFGTLTIFNSLISGNSTINSGDGAGIMNNARATIFNTTISGNSSSGSGGGIFNNPVPLSFINLINCTVTNNTANASSNAGGGGIYNPGTINIRNTIVANNTINNGTGPDVLGTYNSQGHNLVGKRDGSSGFGAVGDQFGSGLFPLDAHLGPLTNNGGPTQTHALLASSIALDGGDNCVTDNTCVPANGFSLNTDQRSTGFARKVDGPDADTTATVDIGAFEAQVSLSDLADQTINEDTLLSLPFNVGGLANITGVTATSSNTALVPNNSPNISISGSGATRTLLINPAANEFGTSTITVTVSGSNSQTMTDTFVLTVNSVNDSPSFTKGADQTVNENNGVQTVNNWATNISTGPANESAQTVSFVVVSNSNAGLFSVVPAISSTGTLTYTPAAGVSGTAMIAVAIMDNGGTANGGVDTSATQSFNITVREGGALAFSAATYSVTENGGSAAITIARSGGSAGTATVLFAASNGTATAGDYTAVSQTITFNDGEVSKTANVPIIDDLFREPDETVNLTLSNAGGSGELGAQITSVLTIVDDDPVGGYLRFSLANFSTTESSGSTTITVERVGDSAEAVTVNYATGENNLAVQPCATVNGFASSRCDFTSALGTLRFAAGETSKTFAVLISQDNYVEGPETLTLALSDPSGGATLAAPYTATLTIGDDATEPATNPVDDAATFVRQHYHDFLNREPDASGLAFWSNQITECQQPGATCNAALRRINVSAAFFLSIEFQETGYLVERLYKTAYGDASGTSNFGPTHQLTVPVVRLNEFLPDSQEIGRGLVVGQTGWEQVLESNKVAFILQFVQRSRFTTAFPTTLTPAQFVDMLFAIAGVTPSASERTSIINEFGGAGTSPDAAARARALRRVAENSTLNQAEKNKAFVLMQFFGYLRRNPNDPQDTDYSGYDFWLTKLNQFNGNFVNADMVQAFIDSGEYRGRFGP
jgi:CSLREA domain-containing protein